MRILTVNGGSSSIKFACFEGNSSTRRTIAGSIEGIGRPQGRFTVHGEGLEGESRPLAAPESRDAVEFLTAWLQERKDRVRPDAVGHRIVHGGPRYWEPQRITSDVVATLRRISPFDPEHLPGEIELIESFQCRFPDLPQFACFDTAFHHDLPRVARIVPIPRRYEAMGVRRYGFHGLSYTYLMGELARIAGSQIANGRVILAHLGNGASLAAVREGKSVDTSMAFTPTAGIPMSTRSGDLDPGLVSFLSRAEQMTPEQFHHMVNHESGLLGISESSPDMRELLAREASDPRAAEAVALFCYQIRKWICALAGALEGVNTLVFSGGIGERAPVIRKRICDGMGWIGIAVDATRNEAGEAVISPSGNPVTVRVIPTDEESVIAGMVCKLLGIGKESDD